LHCSGPTGRISWIMGKLLSAISRQPFSVALKLKAER
jgi:hypothetical protein